MEKKFTGFFILYFALNLVAFSQVDTTYIYNSSAPFGSLDIRIAKSPTNYYYLQEDQTFSFRESAPGARTNGYRDMTSWDSSPYKQGNLREKTDTGDKFVMNYRLLVPQGYNPAFAEGYPMVVILHGYGERGNCEGETCYHADRFWSPVTNTPAAPTNADHELLNNDHNLLHGGKEHLAAVNKAGTKLPNDASLDPRAFPGFVLFPQNLNGWDNFSTQDVIRTVRLLLKKYKINQNRVYIEGISNGGQGMYECLKRAPWLFAAGIGMSATSDGFINSQGVAASVAHIPLWLFQGGMDISPYPGKTQRYIQQFRAVGADIRYTLYPELGHGTWNKAFKEPDFFSWLLDKGKTDIHSFENSKVICSSEGTRLELAAGFPAYQWQLNGQVISGATTAVFHAKTPGTYKARFARVSNPTESQWNPWSDALALTNQAPPQAHMGQIGTVVLKDLNGYANARLQSAEDHRHYYWYKDGTLLNLPGTEDDTLKVATIAPAFGNGAYTLVVADFGCVSPPSAPRYVFFNDTAPVNITAPTNFAGFSTSPSENSLSWTDASANEGNFEIWKRRKTGTTSWAPWELVNITAPNVKTYNDTVVEPLVTYQYKIRAVSSTGRSNYTPAGATEGLQVETVVDTQNPAAPSELKAVSKGVQKIFLSWKSATDNTRIREYIVYYNDDSVSTGSADTTFMLTGIPVNTRFDISVKGVDLSKNISPPSNIVKASSYFSGLYYQHTTGLWTDLDSIDWSWSEFSGTVKEFTLAPKTQDDYFNFSFDGYLYIENSGSYQLRTSSNDGSRLKLDNKWIVDNDGVHGYRTITSVATSLQNGPHLIRVEFFDYIEDDTLLVEYKGPDTGDQWAKVSRDVLKSDENVVTGIGDPDNGPEDSFIVSVYPNPTTQENINVMVETVIPEPIQVRLLDPVGRNVFEQIFRPEEVTGGVSISPEGVMNTGMYVVLVTQGKIRVHKKVIVKRQ